jgi:nucleotide-binding universal stress UspA family protein
MHRLSCQDLTPFGIIILLESQKNVLCGCRNRHGSGKKGEQHTEAEKRRKELMDEIKRILVVSRMTQYCRKAVHCGISMAEKYGAELYVIHVIHNPFGYKGWNLPMVSLEAEYKRMQEKAKAELDEIIESERINGLPVKEELKTGEPSTEILNFVEEKSIDLIIMLAHQEWRLEHFFFGRSNEELIRKMPCSILLLKQEPQPMED